MGRRQPLTASRSSERPLFARRPVLGLGLSAVGGLVFALLALSVRRRSRLLSWDEAACQAMHRRAVRHSRPRFTFMQLSAALGREIALVITLSLGVYWLFQRRWRQLAMLVVGVIGSNTWFVFLSRLFNRQRPVFLDPFHTVRGPGFPSGHSMTGVTLYGLIFYLLLPRLSSWPWHFLGALPTSVAVLLIGFSRFYLGDHYATDVLGGYGFGLFWGALTYTAIDLLDSRSTL